MQLIQPMSAVANRLRFVFSDAVVSFDLTANATLEDVAMKLCDPALRGYGDPIAIDVAWGATSTVPH